MTGGRLKRVLRYIEDDTFLLTYGDGLTNSDINASIAFHQAQGKIVTITAVQPAGRFGDLEIKDRRVTAFKEKAEQQSGFINGGFFVLNRRIGDYLTDDTCVLEQEPLSRLAAEGQIAAFMHTGFWQCMDTYREQQLLTEHVEQRPGALESLVMFNGFYQQQEGARHRPYRFQGRLGLRCGWQTLARGSGASACRRPPDPNLHQVLSAGTFETQVEGDIRDYPRLLQGAGPGQARPGLSPGRTAAGPALLR